MGKKATKADIKVEVKAFTFKNKNSRLVFFTNDDDEPWGACFDAITVLCGTRGRYQLPAKYKNGIRLNFEDGTIEPLG